MTMRGRRLSEGWPLVGWTALAVSALAGTILATEGLTARGWGMATGLTAMTSTLLFLAAFTASALHTFTPGAATRWQLRNRRYLGVSFAVSHTVHAVCFIGVIRATGQMADAATVIGGGLGYAFIYAMVATSFDRTAAWLGPRWWKRLHRTGLYYIWFIFTLTYVGDGHVAPRQLVFLALLGAALVLRVAASRRLHRAAA